MRIKNDSLIVNILSVIEHPVKNKENVKQYLIMGMAMGYVNLLFIT